MPDSPSVTVGFVPRDRYCMAPAALECLTRNTLREHELVVVVDPGMPNAFREPLERQVAALPHARLLSAPSAVPSNTARNLVIRDSDSDYLCLIENDCFVEPGWLGALVDACEQHPAGAAAPLLFEPRGPVTKVHFDDRLGHIRRDPDSDRLRIEPREIPLEEDRGAPRRPTDFVEMHCVLFHRSALEAIGPFDEEQSGSRAEVDLSLALHAAGVCTLLEPASRVTFSPPPPVHPEERDYYRRYWDLEANRADHRRIEARWNLVECPTALGFCEGRQRILATGDPEQQIQSFLGELEAQRRAAEELAAVVPATEAVVLVDDAQWVAPEIAGPRPTFPFLEKDGQYWGAPPDDTTAISELERLHRAGARYLAIGWPAFWWLEHYSGFRRYLEEHYPCRLQNERWVLFELAPMA